HIIKDEAETQEKESFDTKGAILFSFGMLLLLLGLSKIEDLGLTSPLVLISIGLAFALLFFFYQTEKRVTSPMLDLSLFKNRTFFFGTLAGWISFVSMFSINILLPFYLDQILHYDSRQIGLLMT